MRRKATMQKSSVLMVAAIAATAGWSISRIARATVPNDVQSIINQIRVVRPGGYGFLGEVEGPVECTPIFIRKDIWGIPPNTSPVYIYFYEIPVHDYEAVVGVMPWYGKPAEIRDTWPYLQEGEHLVEINAVGYEVTIGDIALGIMTNSAHIKITLSNGLVQILQ